MRYQKEWDNWKIGAGYAYEDFTDELVNNGGGGVFYQGFKRDFKEWAGMASIIHKPTGLFLWGANSNSENDDIGSKRFRRRFHRQGPARHACLGHRRWYQSRVCMERSRSWFVGRDHHLGRLYAGPGRPRRLHADHGLIVVSGTASSYSVWDGEVSAGAFPGIPFTTEITSSETTKWYLAVDQAIDSAAMNVFIAYQHIEPEIKLVTRDPAFSPTGTLKNVPIALDDFDVLFMGGACIMREFGICGSSSQRDFSSKGKLKNVPLELDNFDVLYMGGRIQF